MLRVGGVLSTMLISNANAWVAVMAAGISRYLDREIERPAVRGRARKQTAGRQSKAFGQSAGDVGPRYKAVARPLAASAPAVGDVGRPAGQRGGRYHQRDNAQGEAKD